jgi:hypothetical protein
MQTTRTPQETAAANAEVQQAQALRFEEQVWGLCCGSLV